MRKTFLPLSFVFACAPLWAGLSLPNFFGDHMVLQREQNAAIWGKADPGASVRVRFKGQTADVTADAEGRWKALVPTGGADASGASLVVEAGKDTIILSDVLVGEIWFASGQSNMAFPMRSAKGGADFIGRANYPAFRFFNGPNVTAATPQDNIAGKWEVCSPETIPAWSAVASYFAIKVHQELGVPVGILESSWGGKPIEAFTSREALSSLPAAKVLVDAVLDQERSYDEEKEQAAYQQKLEQWRQSNAGVPSGSASAGRAGKPQPPKRPLNTERNPGVLYDAMIHPFVGFTMRGVIWYQGEANARTGAVPYDQTLPLMINDWRRRWGSDFTFLFVQLANYRAPSTDPGTPDSWALLQDRMRRVIKTTRKTGMAVINDVGEAFDIHPKDKRTPGERLARWALAGDYGRDILRSGPLYESHEIRNQTVTVIFDYAGEGLRARDGQPLKRFEVAGQDHKWHWAEASISGKNSVTVSSPEVSRPVAVRYAWAGNPEGANLVNNEDLPASVFRTDDWADAEPLETPVTRRVKQRDEIRDLGEQLKKLPAKSPQAVEMKIRLDAMMKEFKDSAPNPPGRPK